MNNSSLRIFLLLVFFISFTIIGFTLDGVFDDEKEITSQSFSFENTTIIKFTNNSLEELITVRIWLTDSSFKSLKSENGWTSTIAPQEGIIFITSEPIKTNETVKFGIKTDKPNPLIHWEALDKEENQIEIGKTQSQTIQSFVSTQEQRSIKDLTGILSESTFKIPKKTKAEQVNFVLKDKQENEKIISLQLIEIEQKIPKNIGLTVSETQNEFYRTDRLEFSGTAKPNIITKKSSYM